MRPSKTEFEIAIIPEKGACGGNPCGREYGYICRACDALPSGRRTVRGFVLGGIGAHKEGHFYSFTDLETGAAFWLSTMTRAADACAALVAMMDPSHERRQVLAWYRARHAGWGGHFRLNPENKS